MLKALRMVDRRRYEASGECMSEQVGSVCIYLDSTVGAEKTRTPIFFDAVRFQLAVSYKGRAYIALRLP